MSECGMSPSDCKCRYHRRRRTLEAQAGREIPTRRRQPRVRHSAVDGKFTCRVCLLTFVLEEFRVIRKDRPASYRSTCTRCLAVESACNRNGISVEQYTAQLVMQDRACAICKAPEADLDRRLAIDHDHTCCPETGKSCGKCFRDLLCLHCNMGIGYFRDSCALLGAAVKYLA